MARGQTPAELPQEFGGKEFFAFFKGNPVLEMRKHFQENARLAARKLKRQLAEIIKERHAEGEPGTSYNRLYARRKSMMTRRPYRAGQQYDYEWSGQLHSALEGHARAKPSKGKVNAWLGFRRLGRRPIQRTPGSNPRNVRTLNNRELAETLSNMKTTGEDPFSLHADERKDLLRRTGKILSGQTSEAT